MLGMVRHAAMAGEETALRRWQLDHEWAWLAVVAARLRLPLPHQRTEEESQVAEICSDTDLTSIRYPSDRNMILLIGALSTPLTLRLVTPRHLTPI